MKSEIARLAEKKSRDGKFKFKKGVIIKIVSEKNKLKNKGINKRPNGIKYLKLSSKVKECVIQCRLLKKKPNPNNEPKINKFLLYGFFL